MQDRDAYHLRDLHFFYIVGAPAVNARADNLVQGYSKRNRNPQSAIIVAFAEN